MTIVNSNFTTTVRITLLTLVLGLVCFTNNIEAQYIRSKHTSKVNSFSENGAQQLMSSYCPNTGKNAFASVSKWYYDEYKGEYEIHMSANWQGATWAFGDTQSFYVGGILYVKENGRNSRFKEIRRSSNIEDISSNNNLLVGGLLGLGVLAAMSQE